MATLKELKGITRVRGIKNYILVRNDGKIETHNINLPQYISTLILKCGKTCHAIELSHFRCLLFSRNNNENIFIFPVGNYYLGVIKEREFDDTILIKNVFDFVKSLS